MFSLLSLSQNVTMLIEAPATNVLVERCRNGDRQACRQLYEQYAKAMYNICLRMVNQAAEAEDVLQESFLQVFTHIGSFRGESSLGAWIKRIVINNCLNHLKKRKLRFVEIDEDMEKPVEDSPDEIQFSLTVERVREAIRQLPDGYRIVLNLYLMENHSHREIASMLGITESAAKTQYHRAKEKVRELLMQKPGDLS